MAEKQQKGGIGGFFKKAAHKGPDAVKTEEELAAQESISPDDVMALQAPCQGKRRKVGKQTEKKQGRQAGGRRWPATKEGGNGRMQISSWDRVD